MKTTILIDSNIVTKCMIMNDELIQVFKVGSLDLGNNFSFDHFIDALNPAQIVDIYQKFEGESIRLSGQGNYGKVMLNTNGFDLGCFLKPKYDSIGWDERVEEYYFNH